MSTTPCIVDKYMVQFERKWSVRVDSLAVVLLVGGTTSCSGECNARVDFDVVEIDVPADIATGSAKICVGDTCEPASVSATVVQGDFHGNALKPKSVSVRLTIEGTSAVDAVVTTKPTTDTHGGCVAQRVVSLRYAADTNHLVPGPGIRS